MELYFHSKVIYVTVFLNMFRVLCLGSARLIRLLIDFNLLGEFKLILGA